jgi:hypothetical protein
VQEQRLDLLEQALQVRESDIEDAHRQQAAERAARLAAQQEPKLAALAAQRLSTMRWVQQ